MSAGSAVVRSGSGRPRKKSPVRALALAVLARRARRLMRLVLDLFLALDRDRRRRRCHTPCSRRARPGWSAACRAGPGDGTACDWNVVRRAGQRLGRVHLHADRCVRADHRALAAVDADGRIPDRDLRARSSRFSHRAVPVGNVPSTGSALTGSRSPSPASIRAVTRCTKSGASAGTGGPARSTPVGRRRDLDAMQVRQGARRSRRSCARRPPAALAVGLLDPRLMLGDGLVRRQHVGEREEARLHDRVDPAAESGRGGDRGTRRSTHRSRPLVQMTCPGLPRAGGPRPRPGRTGCSAGTSRRAARRQHVDAVEEARTGGTRRSRPRVDQVRASGSGRGPKRRWDTVIAPDFFES